MNRSTYTTTTMWQVAVQVLRDPHSVWDMDAEAQAALAPVLIGLTAGGMALWGGVIGAVRGGWQLLYAPVKAPLLAFVPLAVCLPLMWALFDRQGRRLTPRTVAVTGLVGAARGGLLAGALAPVLWLLMGVETDYHTRIVWMALSLATASLPGLWTMVSVLRPPGRMAWAAGATSLVLLSLTTAQTGWMLRPFVVRPTAEVTFLRTVEGDVFGAMDASVSASQGDYQSFEPKKGGVLGRGARVHGWEEAAEEGMRVQETHELPTSSDTDCCDEVSP